MIDPTRPRPFHPSRELGRTGFRATAVGIGDLADRSIPEAELVATLRRALDAGLNVIDTAPSYEDGLSERVVGQALRGRREPVFVIDKIDDLDGPVEPQVEASLRRLDRPSANLFVFHGVSDLAAWRALASPGGGMEQLEGCRRAGRCRFRGVSSHDPEVLREAIEHGSCDVVMFAIGPYVDARYEHEILPLARRHGVGTVCFKTFGAGMLLGDTAGYGRPLERPSGRVPLTVAECVRYTLTVGPDVALLGLSRPDEQDAAFRAALTFVPFDRRQMADVRGRASQAMSGKGHAWWNPSA